MLKNYVICRNCEEQGIYKPLGEVDAQGNFWVKRRLDYTVISGDSFQIACSNCNQLAYKKERRMDDLPHIGIEWLFWQGTLQGTIQEIANSGTSTPGTAI